MVSQGQVSRAYCLSNTSTTDRLDRRRPRALHSRNREVRPENHTQAAYDSDC